MEEEQPQCGKKQRKPEKRDMENRKAYLQLKYQQKKIREGKPVFTKKTPELWKEFVEKETLKELVKLRKENLELKRMLLSPLEDAKQTKKEKEIKRKTNMMLEELEDEKTLESVLNEIRMIKNDIGNDIYIYEKEYKDNFYSEDFEPTTDDEAFEYYLGFLRYIEDKD